LKLADSNRQEKQEWIYGCFVFFYGNIFQEKIISFDAVCGGSLTFNGGWRLTSGIDI
jgi:hypothetical protein